MISVRTELSIRSRAGGVDHRSTSSLVSDIASDIASDTETYGYDEEGKGLTTLASKKPTNSDSTGTLVGVVVRPRKVSKGVQLNSWTL